MALVPQGNPAARSPNVQPQGQDNETNRNTSRFVSFSKQKQAIFNKACELSVLCKAETAVIAFSPNENDGVHTFGNPNPDSVINRCIHAGVADDDHAWEEIANLSQEVEIARQRFEEEKKRLATVMANPIKGSNGGCWWDQSVEEVPFEDLKLFEESLQKLKRNVSARVRRDTMTMELPPPPSPSSQISYRSLMDDIQTYGWDLDM